MSDLISIKAAIKFIDLRGHDLGLSPTWRENIKELLRMMPVVDAVPVVRCKECKHRATADCDRVTSEWDDRLERWIFYDCTDDEGFCDYGAKMDGGAEDG